MGHAFLTVGHAGHAFLTQFLSNPMFEVIFDF